MGRRPERSEGCLANARQDKRGVARQDKVGLLGRTGGGVARQDRWRGRGASLMLGRTKNGGSAGQKRGCSAGQKRGLGAEIVKI